MTEHWTKVWVDVDKAVVQEIPLETIYKRKWIGLTKEEAADCWIGGGWDWEDIEAKLKEKNT